MNFHVLRVEGDSGLIDLNDYASKELGYRSNVYRYGSPLERMLSDNPGLIETIYDWIKENLLVECPYCDNFCPSLYEDDVCQEYYDKVINYISIEEN